MSHYDLGCTQFRLHYRDHPNFLCQTQDEVSLKIEYLANYNEKTDIIHLKITIGIILREKTRPKHVLPTYVLPDGGCHSGRLPLPEVLASHTQRSTTATNARSRSLSKLVGTRMKTFRETSLGSRVS